jgi:hypothetical protein
MFIIIMTLSRYNIEYIYLSFYPCVSSILFTTMPTLDRTQFKYNAKVFEKTCLYCGTVYFANRSTAKYCSSTCRGYANQAKNLNEAAPWDETDRTVDALLSQVAYLKGQLQHYINENENLKKNLNIGLKG